MFGWEFPPNISGGLGTACYGIVKGLSEYNDIHISFVIPKSQGNEPSSENLQLISADKVLLGEKEVAEINWENISLIQIKSELSPYITPETFSEKMLAKQSAIVNKAGGYTFPFSGKYGPNLFEEIGNYAAVAKIIAKESDFDLIHAHDWLTFPAAVTAKKMSGKPLIVHIHSTDFDRSGGAINPDIYAIEKNGMDEADQVIVVSNKIKDRLAIQYHVDPAKVTTVYNGIDPGAMHLLQKPTRKERLVTFLGRITIQKGPEYFVDVARMVIKRMKNVHFAMAGNGELRDKILELTVRYGISDKFHFTGFLNGRDVDKMLSKSDLCIMPSVSEPFGIVPLEAMQARVPVIVSLQSGVSEIVHSVIKTDFWDVHAMADAVHGILKYRKLSRTLAAEGKDEVGNFNWGKSATQIRQVYFKTLENKVC
jgi:glycosyltransferase involved in cell wall biosynthesis